MPFPAEFLALLLAASPCAAGESERLQTVEVRPGDTLWGIAHRYLEDPQRWDEILKHNGQLGSDPTIALPGMSLRVPVGLLKPSLRAGQLTYIEGKVLHRPAGKDKWSQARQGMALHPGDMLKTEDWSRARIKFPLGSVLNMDSRSVVVVKPEGSGQADLQLVRGTLRAHHLRLNAGDAAIAPRQEDTVFEARVKDGEPVRVQLFSGSADVAGRGGKVTLQAGQELDVAESGPGHPRPMAASPRPPAQERPRVTATDLGTLKVDVESIKTGVALAGFRVQLSRSEDFKTVVVDRMFEPDERISLRGTGASPGTYWWRAAPVDLLGATGAFSEPKRTVIE